MVPLPLNSLDAAVHLIQVALTPIFLLSGIAALLNVYAGRLARVADRLDHLTGEGGGPAAANRHGEIASLHRRSRLLDLSVVLATAGAVATCLSILTLFFIGIAAVGVPTILLLFFGLALVCTLLSAALFGFEMLISSKVLRERMRLHVPTLPRFWLHRGRARTSPSNPA